MYIANHLIRHNGKLYARGEEVKDLKHAEAQELLKNRAVSKFGKDGKPELSDAEKAAAEAAEQATKDAAAKEAAEKAAAEKAAAEAAKKGAEKK